MLNMLIVILGLQCIYFIDQKQPFLNSLHLFNKTTTSKMYTNAIYYNISYLSILKRHKCKSRKASTAKVSYLNNIN